MWSLTFTIGFFVFILGFVLIYRIRKRNYEKLTPELRIIVEKIKWDLRILPKIHWILIFAVPIISYVLIRIFLDSESLFLSFFIWFIGLMFLKESSYKSKAIANLGVSDEFIKTDILLNYLVMILFIVFGIFILFS